MARDHDLLIIGAAGQMTSVTTIAVCAALPSLRVKLADRDGEAVAHLAQRVGSTAVSSVCFDLFDDDALARAVGSALFVINGAGPYYRTAERVMRACVDARTGYLDIDDDVESTLQALELDAAARAAGVALYVGHGASPGFTNVLARDVLDRLEHPTDVEVAWCVGESRGTILGRAVAEHTMHIGAGDFVGWRNGRRVTRESFALSTVFPLTAPLGDYRLYEVAHPEPVMLGHSFPQLQSAVCWGGLYPQPLNGIIRGLAMAVRSGHLSMDAACGFLQAVSAGDFGSWRGWCHALAGMLRHLRSGDVSAVEVGRYIAAALGRAEMQTASGIGARAHGIHEGAPREVVARVTAHGAEAGDAMAALTGLSAAAFFQLAWQQPAQPGVAFPEMWVRPQQFYAALNARLQASRAHVEVDIR